MSSKKLILLGLSLVVFAACSKKPAGVAPTGQELPAGLVITKVWEVELSASVKAAMAEGGAHVDFNCARQLDYKDGATTGSLLAIVTDPSCMNKNEPKRADIVATFKIADTDQDGIKHVYEESPQYLLGELHAITNGSGQVIRWSLSDLCTGSYSACAFEGNDYGMITKVDIY